MSSRRPPRARVISPTCKRPFTLFRRQGGRVNYRQRQEAGETVARHLVLDAMRRRRTVMVTKVRLWGRVTEDGEVVRDDGAGRGRFAPKKGVIDMVGVVGHLGPQQTPRRRHHHLHHLLLVFLFLPPPPFIAFTLLPIASEGHPCVPLCRVTFGLRTQPNLPGGRPGPPFSTNPGNELRGSRGLLVAMATKPSPNPLNQTPISYPSELRYPLPPPLSRRARRLRCRSLVAKGRIFRYLIHLSLTALRSSPLSHHTCFVSLLRFSFFQFSSSFSLYPLCQISKCQSSFFGNFVLCLLFSFIIIHS